MLGPRVAADAAARPVGCFTARTRREETVTDTLTVGSIDGTAQQTITATIFGTNDPAVIGGAFPDFFGNGVFLG